MVGLVVECKNLARSVCKRLSRSAVIAALAGVSCIGAAGARAQGMFGFGLVVGEPTGLAWKYKINHLNAVDGAIGFSPTSRFRLHVDYLWQAYPFEEQHLAVHYGLGAAFGFGRPGYFTYDDNAYPFRNGDLGFGVRAVVGLTYTIPRSPVDTFFEMAPLIVAAPGPGFGIDVGLGIRVYP